MKCVLGLIIYHEVYKVWPKMHCVSSNPPHPHTLVLCEHQASSRLDDVSKSGARGEELARGNWKLFDWQFSQTIHRLNKSQKQSIPGSTKQGLIRCGIVFWAGPSLHNAMWFCRASGFLLSETIEGGRRRVVSVGIRRGTHPPWRGSLNVCQPDRGLVWA